MSRASSAADRRKGVAGSRVLGRRAESIRSYGVRLSILCIAVIPSIVLGVSAADVVANLIGEARQDRAWATAILNSASPALDLVDAMLRERQLALLRVAGQAVDDTELKSVRQHVDGTGRTMIDGLAVSLNAIRPGSFEPIRKEFGNELQQLTGLRARVDLGTATVGETYRIYCQLLDTGAAFLNVLVKYAPDVNGAITTANVLGLFRATDAMSRAYALAAVTPGEGVLDSESLREFVRQVGVYHAELDDLARSDPELRDQVSELENSPGWRQLQSFENTIINQGAQRVGAEGRRSSAPDSSASASPTIDQSVLQQTSSEVVEKVFGLWRTRYEGIQQRASNLADTTSRDAIWGGLTILSVVVVALLATIWLANRLSRRLNKLRRHTLALADEHLPALIARIRAGEHLAVESSLPVMEFGRDEIGQVADAFESAERVAISAAVTEARTREAVNAVFLNLAHRGQLMAHRQLEILDAAEARQEDPEMLSLLFQLDHLATRERRNAENLIILGGERPGRRWRNPVPLRDIVRSAIAETQDYARVRAAKLPELRVNGGVVADIIHLLSELIDNATSFSPPDSRVEVAGNLVGKGVVVEIIDQGLGMPDAEIARANDILSDTPDFGLLQLSSDSRLGLVVVSMLASRNGIKVRLAESDYGGIKAVVVVPATLLADDGQTDVSSTSLPLTSALSVWPSPTDRGSAVVTPDSDGRSQVRQAPEAPLFDAASETAQNQVPRQFPSDALLRQTHDNRPPLPRRRRQESLAPQLADSIGAVDATPPKSPGARTPEQARDLMSAIENGTRQGRFVRPDADYE